MNVIEPPLARCPRSPAKKRALGRPPPRAAKNRRWARLMSCASSMTPKSNTTLLFFEITIARVTAATTLWGFHFRQNPQCITLPAASIAINVRRQTLDSFEHCVLGLLLRLVFMPVLQGHGQHPLRISFREPLEDQL